MKHITVLLMCIFIVFSCGKHDDDASAEILAALAFISMPACGAYCKTGKQVLECSRDDLVDPCGLFTECLPSECLEEALNDLPGGFF